MLKKKLFVSQYKFIIIFIIVIFLISPGRSQAGFFDITKSFYFKTADLIKSAVQSIAITLNLTKGETTGNIYYVATTGNDANPGTITQPWRTITYASTKIGPGAIVHVAPGNYVEVASSDYTSKGIWTKASGTASARIKYISDTKWGAKITPIGVWTVWNNEGSYVDIQGFEVIGDASTKIGINNAGSFVKIVGNENGGG